MFKSLIKQKLESNFGPRNYKQDRLLQAREKLSWVRGWVWPNLTVNHQVISGITETRANLLARKKFRGSSAKFNNEKIGLTYHSTLNQSAARLQESNTNLLEPEIWRMIELFSEKNL